MSRAAIASGWLGRICAVGLLVVCAALALVHRLAAVDQKRDAKAEEIARAMMQAMGGEKPWYAAHFVRFDFDVNMGGEQVEGRSHLWDKVTGRYRLEEKTKAGKSKVTLFNVNDRQGAVYLDGRKLEGAPAAKALKDAYGAHINDMYWLAMPWKWMDPGANLKYMGRGAAHFRSRGPHARRSLRRIRLKPITPDDALGIQAAKWSIGRVGLAIW